MRTIRMLCPVLLLAGSIGCGRGKVATAQAADFVLFEALIDSVPQLFVSQS